MKTFWNNLKRPFFALAPMDDVTDTVFREIVARHSRPDVMFTEFANTDGFVHPVGTKSVERKLKVNPSEDVLGVPLIAQIWGSNPDHYYQTAKELSRRGDFAGIDINMGCPEKGIVKRGCCGGLIKEENWGNAADIIQATKDGAGDLPVSVKTRIGVNKVITEEWSTHLLSQDITALTIHARTVREMSRVPARWEEIGKVARLRDRISPDTVIIGNGDVLSRSQGEALTGEYGLNGIMVGRGIFQNLFVFNEDTEDAQPQQMIEILLEHLNLYESTWGEDKSYNPMKKFCKLYINGFSGASELRAKLMDTGNIREAKSLLDPLRALSEARFSQAR